MCNLQCGRRAYLRMAEKATRKITKQTDSEHINHQQEQAAATILVWFLEEPAQTGEKPEYWNQVKNRPIIFPSVVRTKYE